MGNLFRLALGLTMAVAAAMAQPILKISGPEKTLSFSAEEFAALPRTEITAFDAHAQKDHKYSGVLVHDLLVKVGAPSGEKLRGNALQLVVVFHSRDNYAITYALAEFDDSFSSRKILLADTEDGKPLLETSGPLRIVAPGDKKGARWARMVTSIEIINPVAK